MPHARSGGLSAEAQQQQQRGQRSKEALSERLHFSAAAERYRAALQQQLSEEDRADAAFGLVRLDVRFGVKTAHKQRCTAVPRLIITLAHPRRASACSAGRRRTCAARASRR